MPFKDIIINGRQLTIHKAVSDPKVEEKTVLASDTWDYVDLWLRRTKKTSARFYWQQARSFYEATKALPKTASPLTAYYCFLNATKALLASKAVKHSAMHGVSGHSAGDKTALANERIRFLNGGVLAALCNHFSEPPGNSIYSLSDLLYNLPFIHRAYSLTFKSSQELFVPIAKPRIVRSSTTHEAWFVAELAGRYATKKTVATLSKFEQELSNSLKGDKAFLVRAKKRFDWRPRNKAESLVRFRNYHRKLRKDLAYIHGPQRLWYLKRDGKNSGSIQRSPLTIMFAAMHRLSELARYTPDKLNKHFECQHDWLLSEFIESAPNQFIDEISSEMTGLEFMPPGRSPRVM